MKIKKSRLLHLVIAIGLVAAGLSAKGMLTASKTQMKKRKPQTPAPMVRTITVETGPYTVRTMGEGTVRPLRETGLVSQVAGKVIYVSAKLVNGGEFSQGDTLLRIEPADYELAVTLAQASVKEAESALDLTDQEAAAARQEWRLLHSAESTESAAPPPLVAKEPQLAAARAKLEAARADLSKALLNVERTRLKAPFDGRVSEENVDIGQYVAPGQALASVYSTDAAEIVVPMEDENAFWFRVPGFTVDTRPGSRAVVRARVAGQEKAWPGEVVRSEGKIDEKTRMLNVVVRVEQPYAKKPPLAVGLFVRVEIEGSTLANAAKIPRSALHPGDVVWVVDKDDRLRFRKIDVARVYGDYAIMRNGVIDGARLVVTPLKAVTDGMAVRTSQGREAKGS